MSKKRGKGIWIILGIIIAIIGIFSVSSCLMGRTEVNTSELHSLLTEMSNEQTVNLEDFKPGSGNGDAVLDLTEYEKATAKNIKQEISNNRFDKSQGIRIKNVLFDGYVVEFDLVSVNTGEVLTFTTNYSRVDSEVEN